MRRVGFALVAGVGTAALLAWRHHIHAPGWPLAVALAALAGGLTLTITFLLPRPRREALVGLAVAGLAGAWLAWAPGAPGVTVVVIDCLSASRLNEKLMPRTWALAQEGYRWEHAQAQSSWTRTSVASMFTGSWPNRHQLYHLKPAPDRLAEGVPLLAPLFAERGWSTALFAEQAQLDPAFGLSPGFDRYGFRDGRAPRVIAKYDRWRMFFRHVPHLAWVHVLDIHKPYTPKQDRGLPIPQPRTPSGDKRKDQALLMAELNHGGRTLRVGEWTTLKRLHEAEVRELDVHLGRLWESLRADGTLDSDWLVITADHGEAFGEHGWFTHGGTPWQELVRIPLVIRPPGGLDAPATMTVGARHIDLAPTLLGLFGWTAEGMDGRDLGPALRGETLPELPSIAEYFQENGRRIAVTLGDRSLVRTPDGDQGFDLAADPGQQAPAAPDPELLGILAAYLAGDGTSGGDVETSAETMRQLELLGYLDEE